MNLTNASITAESFWRYSLECYAYPGVKALCLDCQNLYGLNVNVLLLCGYLQSKSIFLSSEQFSCLLTDLFPLDQQTQQIRKCRMAAKNQSQEHYQAWLKKELESEKAQQEQLIAMIKDMTFEGSRGDNLVAYFSCSDLTDKPQATEVRDKLAYLYAVQSATD